MHRFVPQMTTDFLDDSFFMDQALQQAQRAYEEEEVPIGAVIVHNNRVIGKGYNQTETLKDVTAHAEMLAITAAANHVGSKYLEDCTLYVTIEPCVMCMGAIKAARIPKVVVGALEPKTGYSQFLSPDYSTSIAVSSGTKEEACAGLMRSFFKTKRR
jgi:tRNA(adenine34) deaminase